MKGSAIPSLEDDVLNVMKENTLEQEELQEVAKSSLSDTVKFLIDLKAMGEQTALLFRSGNDLKAQESYISFVNSLETFTTFFGCISTALNLDYDKVQYQGHSLTEIVGSLNNIFNDMATAQESFDWVMLADLIEYEIVPNLNLWQGVFTSLLV